MRRMPGPVSPVSLRILSQREDERISGIGTCWFRTAQSRVDMLVEVADLIHSREALVALSSSPLRLAKEEAQLVQLLGNKLCKLMQSKSHDKSKSLP
jgi:hypothetical protein